MGTDLRTGTVGVLARSFWDRGRLAGSAVMAGLVPAIPAREAAPFPIEMAGTRPAMTEGAGARGRPRSRFCHTLVDEQRDDVLV
jgi:hypothetical protein